MADSGAAGCEHVPHRADDHPHAAQSRPSGVDNLPADLTSFIGGDRGLAEVVGLLSTTRLLTLTCAGGIGKAGLALSAARAIATEYRDGLRLVELAAVADAGLVPDAVAAVLRIAEQPGRGRLEVLADALRHRQLLLVIDNCEHVRGGRAEMAERLLRTGPELRIWTMARSPLHENDRPIGIPGEHSRLRVRT